MMEWLESKFSTKEVDSFLLFLNIKPLYRSLQSERTWTVCESFVVMPNSYKWISDCKHQQCCDVCMFVHRVFGVAYTTAHYHLNNGRSDSDSNSNNNNSRSTPASKIMPECSVLFVFVIHMYLVCSFSLSLSSLEWNHGGEQLRRLQHGMHAYIVSIYTSSIRTLPNSRHSIRTLL